MTGASHLSSRAGGLSVRCGYVVPTFTAAAVLLVRCDA